MTQPDPGTPKPGKPDVRKPDAGMPHVGNPDAGDPWADPQRFGTAFQAFLDANGDQAIAYYTIFKANADGTDFDQIGSFDGQTNTVTLNEQK